MTVCLPISCKEAGVQATPKSFGVVKIRAKFQKIGNCVEIWEKSVKTLAKPLKIGANTLKIRQKWRPTCFGLKKLAPNVCRFTWKLFFAPKTVFMRKYSHKKWSKNFSDTFEESREKSFAPPKICLLLHLWRIWPAHCKRGKLFLWCHVMILQFTHACFLEAGCETCQRIAVRPNCVTMT